MIEKLPLCKCGCGKTVTKSTNKYLWGHSGGGLWQNKYNKNSEEYKDIVEKVKNSTSLAMKGVKKTEEHATNISKGRKKWIDANRKVFNKSMKKMKETKRRQAEDGILSQQHYVNNKSEKEVTDIYRRIVNNTNKTKKIKKENGTYPDIWNKGKTKYNDERIAKYSRENHYLWNSDKMCLYDDKFYDPDYRKYLLERQNKKCFLCNDENNLCLHHIDKDKKNSKENNLVYVCRSCHSTIHNNYNNMTKQIKEKIRMGYLDNTTVTVEAIEMSSPIVI